RPDGVLTKRDRAGQSDLSFSWVPVCFWNGALKCAPQQSPLGLVRSWTSSGPVGLDGSGSARLAPLPLNTSVALPAMPAISLSDCTPEGWSDLFLKIHPLVFSDQHGLLVQEPMIRDVEMSPPASYTQSV